MEKALFIQTRKAFHKALLKNIIYTSNDGVPNFADNSQKFSREVSKEILTLLGVASNTEKLPGQTLGDRFELYVQQYVESAFLHLMHLRPGNWSIEKVGSRNTLAIAQYEQYTHLIDLQNLADQNKILATALGNDYAISPDIVMLRHPEEDEVINLEQRLVDDEVSKQSSLRKTVNPLPLLHASISCKWTLRSDRAQNARSEALNLLRNRKGRAPHIVIITAEPTPSRISSLALGTGDIDCVYHFALYELEEAIKRIGNGDNLSLLHIMMEGKRLKDISDLPLDLAV